MLRALAAMSRHADAVHIQRAKNVGIWSSDCTTADLSLYIHDLATIQQSLTMIPTRKPSIESVTTKESPPKQHCESQVDYYFGIVERALQTSRPSVHLYFLHNNKHNTTQADDQTKRRRSPSLSE